MPRVHVATLVLASIQENCSIAGCIVPAAGPPSQHCDWASFPLSFSFSLFFFSGLLPLSFSLLSINIIITTDIDCPNTAGFYPLSQHHWLSAYLTATRISLPPTAHALARHTAVYHSREGELHDEVTHIPRELRTYIRRAAKSPQFQRRSFSPYWLSKSRLRTTQR